MRDTAPIATTLCIGQEFDVELRVALREVLEEMEAVGEERWWAVGGSQEIAHSEVRVGSESLTIEAETYVGLTISGPTELVETVAGRIAERRRPF